MIEEDGVSFNSQKAFTEDLIRIAYLVRICFSQDSHVVIHSNQEGSGKTTCLKHAFDAFSSSKEVKRVFMEIHGKTDLTEFKSFIEKHLVYKRHKTIGLGPGNSLIAMVDDLCNESISANPELFGAWRSYAERSGWYANGQFLHVEDLRVGITLCTSKRYIIPDIQKRSLCHFINIPLAYNLEAKLQEIGEIWTQDSHEMLQGPYFECFNEILVNITSELLKWASEMYPRTPSNPHYSFTSREALLVIKSNANYSINEKNTIRLLQAWVYDCLRVFGDQIADLDREVEFEEALDRILILHLDMELNEVIGTEDRPLASVSFPRELKLYESILTGEKPSAIVFKPFKITQDFCKKQWSSGSR
jgi:hypothetical protein